MTIFSKMQLHVFTVFSLSACGSFEPAGSLTACVEKPLPVAVQPARFKAVAFDPPIVVEPLSDTGWGEVRYTSGDLDDDKVVEHVFQVFSSSGKQRTHSVRHFDANTSTLEAVQGYQPSTSYVSLITDVDGDGRDDAVSSSVISWGRAGGLPETSSPSPHDLGDLTYFFVANGERFIASVEMVCDARKPMRLVRINGRTIEDATNDLPDSPPLRVQSFAYAQRAGKEILAAVGWGCKNSYGSKDRTPFLFERRPKGAWTPISYDALSVEWGAPMGVLFDADQMVVTYDPEIQPHALSDWMPIQGLPKRLCAPGTTAAMIPWGITRGVGLAEGLLFIAFGADDLFDSNHRGVRRGISSIRAFTGSWNETLAEVPAHDMGSLGQLRGDFRWIKQSGNLLVVTAVAGPPVAVLTHQ